VDLGAKGLLFGGDDQLWSPSAGVIESDAELHSEGEAWLTPTLGNSWVDFGGALGTIRYRKDAEGFVHLRGVMKTGTINTTAFTLPAGYRPAADTRFACVSNNAFGVCSISGAGVVNPSVGSNVSFSLDGITFKAEA
jgi:hypothetical protein